MTLTLLFCDTEGVCRCRRCEQCAWDLRRWRKNALRRV